MLKKVVVVEVEKDLVLDEIKEVNDKDEVKVGK